MMRTHIIPCVLPRLIADAFNRESGRIYTGVLVTYWRVVRHKHLWLSQKSETRWSDTRTTAPMHAHSIDAAQQGFYRAGATTRGAPRKRLGEVLVRARSADIFCTHQR